MTGQPTFRVRGVLFDVDGTLVDTTYLHTVAWWQAFRQLDHDVPMHRIHRAVGMGGARLVDHLLGDDRDRRQDAEILAAHQAVFATGWSGIRALPGAAALLRRCHRDGLAVVLASSAGDRDLGVLRRALDADEHVTTATGSADVENSKPSPDLVDAALQRSELESDETVFVGDAVWDVMAAARLDVPCIGLTSGGTSEAELVDAGAAAVYTDPADLLSAFPFVRSDHMRD